MVAWVVGRFEVVHWEESINNNRVGTENLRNNRIWLRIRVGELTLSLINIEECDIPQQTVNASKIYIQLLQLNEFKSVKVIQCKVEIDRTVKKCGMFSHTMDVHNGKYSYVEEVSREACRRMHVYRNFEIAGTRVTGIIDIFYCAKYLTYKKWI